MLSHWYNHDNLGVPKNTKNKTISPNSTNHLKVPDMSSNHEAFLFSQCSRKSSNSSLKGISANNLTSRIPWKFVILGDAGVGKSALVKQFLNLGFSSVYNPTVEDNYIHNINLPDGTKNCVEILDTSGFYQFPAMKELNIRLGTAFILVFDLQNVKTLKSLVELRQLIVNIKGCEDVPLVLVGNKSDLVNPHDIVHLEEEFNNVLSSFKCVYIETSAKKNTNVSDIFKVIVQLVVKDMEEDFNESEYRRNSSISFVRSLTIGKKKQSEKSRRFSEPAVVTKSKHKSKASSAKESGKSTPSFRKKQKNCTIS